MVNLKQTFKYLNLKAYIISAIILLFIKRPLTNLVLNILGINTYEFFYAPFHFIFALLFIILWGIACVSDIKYRIYKKKTGRNYYYDNRHFHKNYTELVGFFKDADPMKMDTSTLPTMKWSDSSGLVFGKFEDKLISFEPEKNGISAMVWGAPGDGKTTSTIITSCRQFGLKNVNGKMVQKGSVMVTDLKGDIYEANNSYRKIKRFSTIHWQESAHFDPLSEARKMTPQDRAIFLENLSITIIPDENSAESKYFIDGARDFFTGVAVYLLNQNNQTSFPEIIEQIVLGNYSKWVIDIMNSHDILAQAYTNHFYGENEKNVSGCYSKAVSSCRLFSSNIMKTLLTNDKNIISTDDLENCVDIYIQIDPNQITLLAPLIAMIYQSFMSKMLYRKEGQTPPIAFIIDEFGQIPAMPVISQSAALMRAYNCSLMFSCQSLAMIEKHYGIAGRKLLMDCMKCHCFLSIMDPDTREWASKLIGTKKVLKISNSVQKKKYDASGTTIAETRERVFEPEEFGNLPNNDELIIYYKGKYVKAEKTYYFKE